MAYKFYVTVEGTKQGMFNAEMPPERSRAQIAGLSFGYGITTPRDATTGAATGRRVHQPVTFVKQWGASSPQFFQALCTNEVLRSVLFEFPRMDETGEEQVYHSVKLVNAAVIGIEQDVSSDDPSPGSDALPALETVSCSFQRIEIENKDGKTLAADDWTQDRY